MANKKQFTQKTTCKGTFSWAFLTKPTKKYKKEDLEYRVDFIIDPSLDGSQEFIDYIKEQVDASVEEAKASLLAEKKPALAKQVIPHYPFKPQLDPDTGDETGLYVIKFKTDYLYKDGKRRVIGIFDAKGKPVTSKDISIGSGTVGKINFSFANYYMAAKKEAGIKMYMNAVQIIELVNFAGGNGDAASYGFEAEDGFSAEELQEENTFGAEDLGETDQEENSSDF